MRCAADNSFLDHHMINFICWNLCRQVSHWSVLAVLLGLGHTFLFSLNHNSFSPCEYRAPGMRFGWGSRWLSFWPAGFFQAAAALSTRGLLSVPCWWWPHNKNYAASIFNRYIIFQLTNIHKKKSHWSEQTSRKNIYTISVKSSVKVGMYWYRLQTTYILM